MPPEEGNDLDSFMAAAAQAAEADLESDPKSRLATVENKIAALEVVLEEVQKRELASVELASYIKDLRDELKDLRVLRSVYGFVAIALVGLLTFILLALVFVSGSPLYTLPQYPAAVTVVALVTGIVILALTLAKGVHRSSVDRAKEDTTVDVPTLVTELVKQLGR